MTATDANRYQMRGLPCRDAFGNEMPWCVCGLEKYATQTGTTITGGGVLEWCYDEQDAHDLLQRMQKDPRFSQLRVARVAGAP